MEINSNEEYEKFDGLWIQESCNSDGMDNPVENYGAAPTVTFTNNQFIVRSTTGEVKIEGLFSVNPYATPKEIDWFDTFGEDKGKKFLAIYEINRNRLAFCAANEGMERPREFEPKFGHTLRFFSRCF
tara:strand:- start:350 stop:733 length:384 start_codon:yes stop_codon:yes gene_type:complete